MSQMEYHSGKLKKVETIIPLEEFCEELCKKAGIEERACYNKNWAEQVQDSLNDKYFIYKDEIYEFLEKMKADEEWGEIRLLKNSGNFLAYHGSFYNGGTCFEECLEEAFDNLKDEDEAV